MLLLNLVKGGFFLMYKRRGYIYPPTSVNSNRSSKNSVVVSTNFVSVECESCLLRPVCKFKQIGHSKCFRFRK